MNSKVIVYAVAAIGLIIAISAGVYVGTADYEQLSIYAVIAIIIYFVTYGWRNVWWLTTLLVFSGATFYQGFKFEAEHLFVMMLVVASVLSILYRAGIPKAPEMQRAGARAALFCTGILLVYGACHFVVYYAWPYEPTQYSIKSSTKAYFECYASMLCFFWLLSGSYGFYLKKGWERTFLTIAGFCLLMNVMLRAYQFVFMGFQSFDATSEESLEIFSMYVPVINMMAGIYTLRNICPVLTLIFLMICTYPGWWARQRAWLKMVCLSSLGLAMFGAVFSGGRATMLFCVGVTVIVAFWRRRTGAILALGGAAILVFGCVNIFSNEINEKAPVYASRSLQFLMINKGEAYKTIEGSQYVRKLAHKQAYVEWKKDNRSFVFGRSVFYISDEEVLYNRNFISEEAGFVMSAMKSGRTHGLISDLVLQYGIIGVVLYPLAYVAVIIFFWRLRRRVPADRPMSKVLADSMAIYTPMMFVYQLAGGTFMPMVVPLAVGLIRADLARGRLGGPETLGATPN